MEENYQIETKCIQSGWKQGGTESITDLPEHYI